MNADFRRRARNLVFLDIETVACVPSYYHLSERMQQLWDKKAKQLQLRQEPEALLSPAELFYERGAIYAEFGKIVCIGIGAFFWNDRDEISFKVRTYAHDDEATLLRQFKELVEKYPADQLVLCAHNGKEFDFPFICRRMLINGIELPRALQLSGKKPWEILHQDTMEMWKYGDYKSYTSLDLLTAVFDIPSSKSEMSGDQVTRVYYEEKDLERICRYCREDVAVLAQLYLRLHHIPIVEEANIYKIEV